MFAQKITQHIFKTLPQDNRYTGRMLMKFESETDGGRLQDVQKDSRAPSRHYDKSAMFAE